MNNCLIYCTVVLTCISHTDRLQETTRSSLSSSPPTPSSMLRKHNSILNIKSWLKLMIHYQSSVSWYKLHQPKTCTCSKTCHLWPLKITFKIGPKWQLDVQRNGLINLKPVKSVLKFGRKLQMTAQGDRFYCIKFRILKQETLRLTITFTVKSPFDTVTIYLLNMAEIVWPWPLCSVSRELPSAEELAADLDIEALEQVQLNFDRWWIESPKLN